MSERAAQEVVLRVVVESAPHAAAGAPGVWRPKGGRCMTTPAPLYGLGKKLWYCPPSADHHCRDCVFVVAAVVIVECGVKYLNAEGKAWAEADVAGTADASYRRWPRKYLKSLETTKTGESK